MIADTRRILISFSIFALVGLALFALIFNTMVNGVPGATRSFTAHFTNVSGLSPGDDVRVAGVRVGRVSGISLDHGGAEVRIAVSKDQPVLSNSTFVMRYQNLLGQRYLALVQPAKHGTELPAGASIPASRTSPGFDLTALLNGFRPLFETLRPADVNTLATSLIKVLQGEGGTVQSLLQQTTRLTNFVADRDQVIGQVLTGLTPVLDDIAGQGQALAGTLHELRLLMTGLAGDRVAIGRSVDGLSKLIGSTSQLLAQERRPTVESVHQLRRGTATIVAHEAEVVRAVASFGKLFGGLGRATSTQNALNVYLCTMWVKLGGAEANLSGGTPGPWSKVCR